MREEQLESVSVTEVMEFESQLLDIIKAAYEGDEKALEIMLKMKQAIVSF
ncbi:hypothetical protein NLU03_09880 [Bacillus toyonensis]|nr:hypothetical protein [Bacillus toyonensis]